jgi:type I restriction-modification system DNA methylase subunit
MRTTEAIKKFEKALEQLAYTQPLWTVFQDFLDFSLLMLKWWDPNPVNFAELEKKYPEKKQHILFAEAYLAMADIADNEGEGFKDPFGNYFMDHFSSDRRGQFFTPEEVCDMMAMLQVPEISEKKIRVYVTQPAVAVGHFYLQLN